MLKQIYIRNFAIAEQLDIEFQPGLNILTGETGAGKSILVGAISAVLGGRVYTEVVRTGAEKAFVEAIFDISRLPAVKRLLEEKGLDSNSELILKREISVKGSTRAFVNDMPVTISTLSEIGNLLVDIHGQNEHQTLLRKETHRYFLDAFGHLDALLHAVSEKYGKLREAEEKLKELENKQKTLEEKYELYRFQLNEIDQAQLDPGEEERLEAERKIQLNAEKIFALSAEFNQLVAQNDRTNLLELMGQAVHLLRELSDFSEEIQGIYREFSSAKIIVEEAARSVETFQNTIEFDPVRLEEIEQRLATISMLKKKYGNTIEEILKFRDQIEAELQLKENFSFELEKFRKIFRQAAEEYRDAALQLSRERRKAAQKLEKEVMEHLQKIGMPKTRFQVRFELIEDEKGIFQQEGKNYFGDENGIDQIEFYISPNPGEDFKPLAKIASGGEISRIMLALKNILAEIDRIPLLIFDEIDSGVSGKIAISVGRSIRNLAGSHQIICITHLPQIASFGNAHYRVEKYVQNKRTFTRIYPLDQPNRVEEIARLMGGEQISETILQSAEQLIQEAENGSESSKSNKPQGNSI